MDKYYAANAVLSLFSKNYMDMKKDLPIRPSEMGVLNILAETPGPHTPVMLAGLLGVSKPMITAHITSLMSRGYITKQLSDTDRRAYYIQPTDKALELVRTVRGSMGEQLDRLIAGMGQEEFDTLVRLAGAANDIMKRKGE